MKQVQTPPKLTYHVCQIDWLIAEGKDTQRLTLRYLEYYKLEAKWQIVAPELLWCWNYLPMFFSSGRA